MRKKIGIIIIGNLKEGFRFYQNVVNRRILVQKYKRNLFLNVNDKQKAMLFPVFVSCFCACLVGLFCLNYFLIFESETIEVYNVSVDVALLKIIIPFLLILIMIILIFLIFWTYYISNKLLGSYNRIVNDLDAIVEGKSREPLGTRKGDSVFEGLLLRINALIRKLP